MKQNTSPKEQKISKQKPIIIDEINNHDGNESDSDISEHYMDVRQSMSVDEVLDEMPPKIFDIKHVMKKKRNQRTIEENNAIKDFVVSVKFFRQAIHTGQVSIDAMDDICANIRMKVYEKNSIVFRQGDPGDAFYIVVEGLTHVLINPEGGFSKTDDEKFAEEVMKDFEEELLS